MRCIFTKMTVWQTHSSRKTLKSIAWTHKCMGFLMWHTSHCWSLLFCHIYWTHREIRLIRMIIFYSLCNLQTSHCLLTGTLSVIKKKIKLHWPLRKMMGLIHNWGLLQWLSLCMLNVLNISSWVVVCLNVWNASCTLYKW